MRCFFLGMSSFPSHRQSSTGQCDMRYDATVLMHNKTNIGIVPWFWLYRGSGRFKIDFGWNFVYFSHSFVLKSWMCQKQSSGSHSSTEFEVISLSAGVHMDAIPAFEVRDLVIEVLHFPSYQLQRNRKKAKGDLQRNLWRSSYCPGDPALQRQCAGL